MWGKLRDTMIGWIARLATISGGQLWRLFVRGTAAGALGALFPLLNVVAIPYIDQMWLEFIGEEYAEGNFLAFRTYFELANTWLPAKEMLIVIPNIYAFRFYVMALRWMWRSLEAIPVVQ